MIRNGITNNMELLIVCNDDEEHEVVCCGDTFGQNHLASWTEKYKSLYHGDKDQFIRRYGNADIDCFTPITLTLTPSSQQKTTDLCKYWTKIFKGNKKHKTKSRKRMYVSNTTWMGGSVDC